MEIKIIITINYYYYLIIIIPITLFISEKSASYLDYFEVYCSTNLKYMFFFFLKFVNERNNMKFIVFSGR